MLQRFAGFLELGESLFRFPEGAGVHPPTHTAVFHGMLEMEHLVEENIANHEERDAGIVEQAAQDDGVVGGVVVSQESAGALTAPAEAGFAHQAVKELEIQIVEEGIEVVMGAGGAGDELAAALFADEGEGPANVLAVEVEAVAVGKGGGDLFAEEFADEDMDESLEDGGGGAFEQVAQAEAEGAVAEFDGGVGVGKTAELEVDAGQGGARLPVAEDAGDHLLAGFKE